MSICFVYFLFISRFSKNIKFFAITCSSILHESTKKKFGSEIQLVMIPTSPSNKKRTCGTTNLNLFFYIYNFLMTSKSYKTPNQAFRRVIYRQKMNLSKGPDPNSKMHITLAIIKKTKEQFNMPGINSSSSVDENQVVHSLSNFSKISWTPKESEDLNEYI